MAGNMGTLGAIVRLSLLSGDTVVEVLVSVLRDIRERAAA